MPIWDIIGPVMIGPSSSHTAGAVRLGRMIRLCWGERDKESRYLYERQLLPAQEKGMGLTRLCLPVLLGFTPDDRPCVMELKLRTSGGWILPSTQKMSKRAHPNSARVVITGGERTMEAIGASVGGGAVELQELDGFQGGEYRGHSPPSLFLTVTCRAWSAL